MRYCMLLGFLRRFGKMQVLFLRATLLPLRFEEGKKVLYFKSSKVVEKARKQFNCPTLKGPEVEDEGGGGTPVSHWERRNHKDDIMSGITDRYMFLTPITLAVMEDSGHYIVDWSKAEN
eukprot:Tbor_TRINITY_DN6064_c1_g1::TRINITY_DN6064_c1_g1_i19::g.10482::m.10482